ncbi:MAG: glycosyltransferase 61 family protein [Cyclobacteriaceae bacterium]
MRSIELNYAIKGDDVLIEPSWGWGLQSWFKIIAESHPYWVNAKRGWPPYPSITNYLNPFKKVRRISQAIPIHYGWDNYYHFHIDTLPVLLMTLESPYDKMTLVVPDKIRQIAYVQSFLEATGILNSKEIIYQGRDEFIQISQRAIFLKTDRSHTKSLKQYFNQPLFNIHLRPTPSTRIFVIRRQNRTATNLEELTTIAANHNYLVIDPGSLGYLEQIALFRKSERIVGFHGAGLTNMLFSTIKNCNVLEIFPRNHIPGQYWLLSRQLDFKYSHLLGSSLDETGNYQLDPEEFRISLERLEVD